MTASAVSDVPCDRSERVMIVVVVVVVVMVMLVLMKRAEYVVCEEEARVDA